MDMQKTGLHISELRRAADLTQMDLADRIGVSFQAVSSWERGLTMPDIAKLPEIAAIFGVSVDDLLGGAKAGRLVRAVAENPDALGEVAFEPWELVEAAPVLKPSQVEALAGSTRSLSFEDVVALAPFVHGDTVDRLAVNCPAPESMEELAMLAPFLSRPVVDRLAQDLPPAADLEALVGPVVFMSKDVAAKLAERVPKAKNLEELAGIAPFIGRDAVERLLETCSLDCDLEALMGIAPFVHKDTMDRVVRRWAKV